MQDLIKKAIKKTLFDAKIRVHEMFDRNFETKSFFGEKWQPVKREPGIGSLMTRTGTLRNSISSRIDENTITFYTPLAYASIHNKGGRIKITKKMRKYFWYKYYSSGGGMKGKKDSALSEYYRNMAMHRGQTITVPKRQFIGTHEEVTKAVEVIANDNFKDIAHDIAVNISERFERD